MPHARAVRMAVRDYPGEGDRFEIRAELADDLATGATTYKVSAPRVSGAVVISAALPDWHDDHRADADTTRIRIEFGHRPAGWRPGTWESERREAERADRLTVNGIALVGGVVVDTDVMRGRRLNRHDVRARRDSGPYRCAWAPDATAARTAIVLHALVQHWDTRGPITHAHRITAARLAADRLRPDLDKSAQREHETIAAARARLDQLAAAARELEVLAAAPPAA